MGAILSGIAPSIRLVVLFLLGAWLPPVGMAAAAEPQSIMAESGLIDDGKPVFLELIVYRPDGEGPFPIVVFNHGSTGSGDRPELFRRSMAFPAVADYFNRRGYMVVFPQRRGRGRSGGRYAEGFTPDGSHYSCEPASVDPAVERAVADIRAAIAIVQSWPDVDSSSLLLAGHSRGGILALLTAAGDTDGISAVINFSGGWLGQACERYRKINRQLFRRAAKWTGPSLFLYSDDDPFYPLGESRKSHAAFVAGGGAAAFGSPILPAGSNGHMLVDYADAWGDQVTKFLRSQVTLPD